MSWPDRLGASVIVLHDENQVIHRWRPLLMSLASDNAAAVVGPYWAPRMPLPLQVADIQLVHSHDSTLVQIADIIAGSTVTWLTEQQLPNGRWGRFSNDIEAAGIPDLIENEVWPLPLDGQMGRFSP